MSRLAITIAASVATAGASLGSFEQQGDFREQGIKEIAASTDPLAAVREGKEVLRPASNKHAASSGPAVKALQQLLNDVGTEPQLQMTGTYDSATLQAVKNFQQAVGLSNDGKAGKNTLQALESRVPGTGDKILDMIGVSKSFRVADPHIDALNSTSRGRTITVKNATPQEVKALQAALNAAGAHPPLAINGEFNERTQQALIALKQSWLDADKAVQLSKDKITTVTMEPVVTAATVERLRATIADRSSPVMDTLNELRSTLGVGRTLLAPASKETLGSALAFTLKVEGGLNSDARDKGNRGGNVTLKGVTQPVFDRYIDDLNRERKEGQPARPHQSLRDGISDSDLRGLYDRYYFVAGKCDKMAAALAIVHFDSCVNMGVGGAGSLLQDVLGVEIDGKIGPKTIAALAATDPAWVVNAYLKRREEFCLKLAERSDYSQYKNGWLNRISALKTHVYEGMPPAVTVHGGEPSQYFAAQFPNITAADYQAIMGLRQTAAAR